jgi:hypothetical protein
LTRWWPSAATLLVVSRPTGRATLLISAGKAMAERQPFDPSRIQVPESERLPPVELPGTITPRQVNELVRGALARHIPQTLHVLGEIADLSRPQSGHIYFSLKDPHSELRCAMWRSTAVKLKFQPEPGMEVIATGGLEVYTPRGTYQLIVRKLEPRGVGALEVAFRQLKERLEREGLFDPARKKPLPKIPQRIAVVTSPTGAAIRDIVQTLARRFPALEILVWPVRVQGEGAAAEIAEAIRQLNRHAAALGGIDVAIVGRGGGSLEDLWAFNEEVAARAIAASEIPIILSPSHLFFRRQRNPDHPRGRPRGGRQHQRFGGRCAGSNADRCRRARRAAPRRLA